MLKNIFIIREFSSTYEYKTKLILDTFCHFFFFLFHVFSLSLDINATHQMPKSVLLPALALYVHIYSTLFYFCSCKDTVAWVNKIKLNKGSLIMGKMTHQEQCLTWLHILICHSQDSLPPCIFPLFFHDDFRGWLSQI